MASVHKSDNIRKTHYYAQFDFLVGIQKYPIGMHRHFCMCKICMCLNALHELDMVQFSMIMLSLKLKQTLVLHFIGNDAHAHVYFRSTKKL